MAMLDKTRHSDLENLYNLVNCVKTLETEFEKGINDGKIDTDDKMLSYQNEFWESHLKCIDSCNDTYMNINEHAAANKVDKCCKKIWDFCCMITMYNEMIYAKWPTTDSLSRKLTILIAICDIEQFRCEKNLNNKKDTDKDSADEFEPTASSTPKYESSTDEPADE